MTGRGFSQFVNNFERELLQPDLGQQLQALNHQASDEERKQHLKAYARRMRDQPGFQGTFDKLGISDSEGEDESGVPSLEQVLADLDSHDAQSSNYGKAIFSGQDAVRSFLGGVLDAPAPLSGYDVASPAPAAPSSPSAASSATSSPQKPPRWQAMAAKAVPSSRRGQLRQAMGGSRGTWEARLAEAAARREEEQRLAEERIRELRQQGWAVPSTDKFVRSTTLIAEGAASEWCNGRYIYDGTHKGRPLFKTSAGAIIYFNEFWKMNSGYKVTSWLYAVTAATGQLPPVGQWASETSKAPKVTTESQVKKVMGEKSGQIMLEDGETLQKNLENKSWCWADQNAEENNKENVGEDGKAGTLANDEEMPELKIEVAEN